VTLLYIGHSYKVLDDSIRLLKLQESFDQDIRPRVPYVGLSVNETLFRLIVDQETSKSSKFQSTFKVSEEAFWNIKLRALVSARRLDELRTWSGSKKSPIGYEVSLYLRFIDVQPFVVACMEAGKWNEMEFFLVKCISEKDLEKLKELRTRNIKENAAKALDEHFSRVVQKKGKGR
jgi:vacuolar protein sorting-associated protein 16